MDPCLVISPHLDDAVLSAGQFLAGWPGCVVATACAGIPDHDATDFDRHSGFRSGAEAVTRRRAEDIQALRSLRARNVHLDYLDGQYGQPLRPADLAATIVDLRERVGAIAVAGPAGLVHPDHERVARAYRLALPLLPADVACWVYEDLPSRVLWPDAVPPALAKYRQPGLDLALDFAGTGPKEAKRTAIRCYYSQAWALDADTLYVPERFWRITRCA